MQRNVNIDVGIVVQILTEKFAEATRELAIKEAHIAALNAQLDMLMGTLSEAADGAENKD
jgi:hypothetical protein